MANSSKNVWIVIILITVGAIFFLFSLKPKSDVQGVVLGEVFKQTPEQPTAAPVESVAQLSMVKDPVPSPAIVTSPENGHEAGFAVQVYSFQDRSRADKALNNLKEAGYKEAFMEVSNLGEKGTWYRVRIGSLANETQAKAMLEEVRRNYNSGFIVKPIANKK